MGFETRLVLVFLIFDPWPYFNIGLDSYANMKENQFFFQKMIWSAQRL